jgi:hypothetical protein
VSTPTERLKIEDILVDILIIRVFSSEAIKLLVLMALVFATTVAVSKTCAAKKLFALETSFLEDNNEDEDDKREVVVGSIESLPPDIAV